MASVPPATYRRDSGARAVHGPPGSPVETPTDPIPTSQGLSTLGGGYCHDLFPELSPYFVPWLIHDLCHIRTFLQLPSLPTDLSPIKADLPEASPHSHSQ